MTTRTVPAGAFKQGCLALLDEVASGGVELVVTKRGKPVARLVPVADAAEREAATLASLRSRTRLLVDGDRLLEPTSRLARWRLTPGARDR